MTELLPCPFCGAVGDIEEAGNGTVMVLCMFCYCSVGESWDRNGDPNHRFRTRDEAAEAWNTRAEPLHVASCCGCGRIVDTREASEGGDAHGVELSDGRWTCSPQCWDAVTLSPADRAELASRSSVMAVPEGWQLVPVEPSWEMQIRGRDAIEDPGDDDGIFLSTDDAHAVYAAMLAAAPRCRQK